MIQTCFKYIFEQKGKGLKVEIPPTDDVHEAVFPLMVPIQILRPLAQLWMINMMLVVPPEKKKTKTERTQLPCHSWFNSFNDSDWCQMHVFRVVPDLTIFTSSLLSVTWLLAAPRLK